MSGGMDSCVTAAIAALDHELAALHAGYGQRTQGRERKAFSDQCDHFRIPPARRLEISLEHLGRIGGSALTDTSIGVPAGDPGREGVPSTYVPFRNTHLLAGVVSWAEVIGAPDIFIGAVEEDSSGYPDCTQAYYDAFNELVEAGTRPETHIRIITPLISMSKAQIVRKGVELGAPLHLTWSCYTGTELACGRCDSCILRLRGFQQAGVPDPIPYAMQ